VEAVRVTGIGEVGAVRGESLEGLIFRAASAALADAELTRDDLDGVVIAASDQVDGRAISSMLTSGPAGAYLNDEINVASSPGHALALACMQVASGTHRRLLVSSWGKASESAGASTEAAERLSTEPFFERDAGLTRIAAAGIQAQIQRASHGDRERAELAAASVASKNHAGSVSVEQVLGSPHVAAPLRSLECPPEHDGAFSLVLEDGGRPDVRGVGIEGLAWLADSGRIAERDLVGVPHLRQAAGCALSLAGVKDPASDVQVWELHDYSPDAEIAAYVALGLCSAEDVLDCALGDGDIAMRVNPLGGSVRGEAPFGGPLRKALSAVRHVRGGPGASSMEGVQRAGAQISSGFAGQFQSVFVFAREDR
jgi:acetyl-CoA acetyltransferase